ncbi:MAG: T9SS type A sorting domain-containing protein [Bacteroidota bacterium]|nr:T9SS type A sorting domain-containing protein [Bacteroidota bacterium]
MKNIYRLLVIGLIVTLSLSFLMAQPKYRTFNQINLAEKKQNAGKVLSSDVCFIFKNDEVGIPVNSLHARFNSAIVSVINNGGFTSIELSHKNKVINATGKTVAAGDSVTLCFNLAKKAPGAQANYWQWDTNGTPVGNKRVELAGSYSPISIQPNGGNVREYIYKKIITRPQGVFVGMPTDTPNVGWIRYKTADRKYYPHNGAARCFDLIATGSSITKPFVGEHKNLHVKKHNNHLLGEVHALKLAIIANDSGATEPTDTTALGDLIYNDLTNPSDPCNGFILRKVVAFVDSALTYCDHFNPGIHAQLDTCVTRINRAFDGPYVAVSLIPFLIAGTHTVEEVPFIHPNPSAAFFKGRLTDRSLIEQIPSQAILQQNYPNPFNPTTTIDFTLAELSVVTLKIYNMLGQEVMMLLDREEFDEGEQSVEFDASHLPSGIYFYKIIAQGSGENQQQFQAIKRMVLVK